MSEAAVQFDLLYSAIKQHDANDEKYSQSLHSNSAQRRTACRLLSPAADAALRAALLCTLRVVVSEVSEAELRDRLHAVEMVVFELGMRQSAAMRAGRDMDVMGERHEDAAADHDAQAAPAAAER